MFINETDFKSLKEAVEKLNPGLIEDKEATKGKIKELEYEAEKLLAEWKENPDKEDQFRMALDVLGQGRNFMALLVGLEQVDFLAGLPEKETEKSPLETRHVAILVNAEVIALTLKNALGVTAPESLRFKIYRHCQELNNAILSGEVCGIIGLNHDEGAHVDSFIRHDLKNRPGWSYRMSNEYLLPPCADLSVSRGDLVMSIIETAKKMQAGEFFEKKEVFNLDDCLPELRARMKLVQTSCRVCVVDDRAEEISGIIKILTVWPGIVLQKLIYKGNNSMLGGAFHIILMDEDLGSNTTGSNLVSNLRKNSKALFASISGGGTPSWCTSKSHFGLKSSIERSRESAIAFVEFMNRLLENVDC